MQKDSWAHQRFVHESHSLQSIPGFLSRTDGMASRICVELLPHYYQIIIRWNRPKGYTTLSRECPNLRFTVLLTLAALGAGKLPELVCSTLPVFGIGGSLVAQVVNGFRTLVVGIHRAGCLDHGTKGLGIFQHRAGTEHIVVEGLVVMVSHEQGASQSIQQAGIVDIAV